MAAGSSLICQGHGQGWTLQDTLPKGCLEILVLLRVRPLALMTSEHC